MNYLIALSLLTNVIVVWLTLRAGRGLVEDREDAAVRERDALLGTIHELCQRVQAPDLAVIDHQAKQGVIVNPPAVGFDDDEDYWEAAEMTKEQVAEQMMAHELARNS